MVLHANIALPDSETLINIGKEIFVFLGLKVFTSDNSYMFRAVEMQGHLQLEEPQLKIIQN